METRDVEELLADLRARGNDQSTVEAKRARNDLPQGLWRSVVAFANQRGGLILLGVDEKQGFTASGVTDAGITEQRVAELCCNELEPPIRPFITSHKISGRWVVAVEVPAVSAAARPVFHRGEGVVRGSYIRVADNNRQLSDYEVSLLLANRTPNCHDRSPVTGAEFDELDSRAVATYLQHLHQVGSRSVQGVEDRRALLDACVLTGDPPVPTMAGLLVLGRYPQRFFPQLRATFVSFPTSERGELGPRGERFLDSVSIDGSIPEIIAEAVLRILRASPRAAVVHGTRRYDIGPYPEVAVREAITNAFVHRDYSASSVGAPVQIEMFPDRLVVRNPGGLAGPLHVEDLANVEVSTTRNPALLRILEDVVLPGGGAICEARGSGIPTIMRALSEADLPAAHFNDSISTFAVTFFRGEGDEEAQESQSESHDAGADAAARARPEVGHDEVEQALLATLQGGPATRRELVDRTGRSARVVLARLRRLRDEGLVRQTSAPTDPHGRWELT